MPDPGTIALLGGAALLLFRRGTKTVAHTQATTGEPSLRYVSDGKGGWYAVAIDPNNELGLDQRAHLASLQVPGYLIGSGRTHTLVTRTTGPGTRVAVARVSAPPPGAVTTFTGIRAVSSHLPSGPMGGTIVDEDVHNIQLAQAAAGVLAAGLDAAGVLQAGIVTAPLAIVSGTLSLALGNPVDANQITQLAMSAIRYAPTAAEAVGLIASPAAEVAAGTIAGSLISALPVIGLAAGFATQSPTAIAGSFGSLVGASVAGAAGAFAGGLVALPIVIGSIMEMLDAPSVEWMRFAGEVAKTTGLEQDINYKLANLLLVADNDAAIQAGVLWYNNQLRTRVGNLPAQTDPYQVLVGPSTIGTEHGAPYDPTHPGFDEEIYVAGLQAMVNSARRGDPWQQRLQAYRQAIVGPTNAFYSHAFGRLGFSPQDATAVANLFGGDFGQAYFAALKGLSTMSPADPHQVQILWSGPGFLTFTTTPIVGSAVPTPAGYWHLVTQADLNAYVEALASRMPQLAAAGVAAPIAAVVAAQAAGTTPPPITAPVAAPAGMMPSTGGTPPPPIIVQPTPPAVAAAVAATSSLPVGVVGIGVDPRDGETRAIIGFAGDGTPIFQVNAAVNPNDPLLLSGGGGA